MKRTPMMLNRYGSSWPRYISLKNTYTVRRHDGAFHLTTVSKLGPSSTAILEEPETDGQGSYRSTSHCRDSVLYTKNAYFGSSFYLLSGVRNVQRSP